MALVIDYGKAMARQRWLAQQEDERVAQGEATQQPAGAMRGQEGGTTRGQQEMMQQPASMTRLQEGGMMRRQDNKTTIGQRIERQCNNQLA
jgi:hypothetical protein